MLSYGYKDEKISLPNFLVNATASCKGYFTNSVKRLFKLVQSMVKVYPDQVKDYSQCLVDIALIFIKTEKPASEKEAAAHLISELLQMNAMSSEVDIGNIITETLSVLNKRDTLNLSRLPQQLFLILGMISKTHQNAFNSAKANEFRDLLMNRILSLFKDDKATIHLTMISGAIEGLTIHLQNFAPTEEEDQTFGKNLYESMLWLTDPKKAEEFPHNRDAFRKMLELITKHSNIHGIPDLMFGDYKKWQSVFLKWMSSGNYDDQNAGVQAMQTFHERIAEVLEKRKDTADVAVLQYFLDYFSKTLKDEESQPHEIRIAIRGFGAMAAACKVLKETNYLSKLFDLVMQRTEYSYYTNDRLKRRKVLEHLPSYVQSLSKIMNQLDEISGIQLQSLQNVIVVLIRDFHFLPTVYHSIVPISLMETFLNLQKSGEY